MEINKKDLVTLAISLAKSTRLVCEASRRNAGYTTPKDILTIDSGVVGYKPSVQIDLVLFYELYGDTEYAYHDTPYCKTVETEVDGVRVLAVVQ